MIDLSPRSKARIIQSQFAVQLENFKDFLDEEAEIVAFDEKHPGRPQTADYERVFPDAKDAQSKFIPFMEAIASMADGKPVPNGRAALQEFKPYIDRMIAKCDEDKKIYREGNNLDYWIGHNEEADREYGLGTTPAQKIEQAATNVEIYVQRIKESHDNMEAYKVISQLVGKWWGKFMLDEFKKFIARGNVIDLAVGIIMGAAFTGVVNSLVSDIVMPPLGRVMGGLDFSDYFISLSPGSYANLKAAKDAGAATLNYGLFINHLLNFLIVSFCVFIMVRQVNRFYVKQDAKPAEPPRSELLLEEIRDLLKQKA